MVKGLSRTCERRLGVVQMERGTVEQWNLEGGSKAGGRAEVNGVVEEEPG